jgi:tRNA A-37 threonylcarbamoyl transferase component Bud32
MNSAGNRIGGVGKAITVYPPQAQVVTIARRLAAVLVGFAAPRVNSDRRVRPDAPVYYRYGPFLPNFRVTENGDCELVVIGPSGEIFPGEAGPGYRAPGWVRDPFETDATETEPPGSDDPALLGGRYRLVSGVARAARGNVYRAVDTATGAQVVLKEARAYVGEDDHGDDVRAHLRKERRVLQALDGVAGVPQVIDHFRHGDDEFLVTTSMGACDLRRDVLDRGAYASCDGVDRSLAGLASQLLAMLDAIHARGVVMRDLAPKNVVLDESGRPCLVDFEISRLDGEQRYGWTPGYSPPEQRRDAPACPDDDYYALGATLFYAATGLEPVRIDEDATRNVERTLSTLAGVHPGGAGVVGLIPGLLAADRGKRSAAAAEIRAGRHRAATPRPSRSTPAPAARLVEVSPDLLDQIIAHTVEACLTHARELMRPAELPQPTNAHLGSAGIGLELLHHTGMPGVRRLTGDLARWTAGVAPVSDPPLGLLFGSTGTAIFLTAAGLATGDGDLLRAGAAMSAPAERSPATRDDYTQGLAGVGTGHLILAGLCDDPGRLELAAQCARRLITGDAQSTAQDVPQAKAGSGVSVASGFAHGRAGVACFLLAYYTATGDPAVESPLTERYAALAAEAPELIAATQTPQARPMSASWCQGLAGIGFALLRAARPLGEDRYLALACDAARASVAMAPRMWVVSQCCGMAGVGELLVDLGAATGDEERFRDAERVLALMLARCGGPVSAPRFPDHASTGSSGAWGVGSSGVLSFMRRLRARGGPRLWTAD